MCKIFLSNQKLLVGRNGAGTNYIFRFSRFLSFECYEISNNSSIDLISVTGQVVKSVQIKTKITLVDVSYLRKGLYTIRVLNENDVSYEKLIIE